MADVVSASQASLGWQHCSTASRLPGLFPPPWIAYAPTGFRHSPLPAPATCASSTLSILSALSSLQFYFNYSLSATAVAVLHSRGQALPNGDFELPASPVDVMPSTMMNWNWTAAAGSGLGLGYSNSSSL